MDSFLLQARIPAAHCAAISAQLAQHGLLAPQDLEGFSEEALRRCGIVKHAHVRSILMQLEAMRNTSASTQAHSNTFNTSNLSSTLVRMDSMPRTSPRKRVKGDMDSVLDQLYSAKAGLEKNCMGASDDILPHLLLAEQLCSFVEAMPSSLGLEEALLHVLKSQTGVRAIELKCLQVLALIVTTQSSSRATINNDSFVFSILIQNAHDAEISLECLRIIEALTLDLSSFNADANSALSIIASIQNNLSNVEVCRVGCKCLARMMELREELQISLAKSARLFSQALRDHLPNTELAIEVLHILSHFHSLDEAALEECTAALSLAMFALPENTLISLSAIGCLRKWSSRHGLRCLGPVLGLLFKLNDGNVEVLISCVDFFSVLADRDEARPSLARFIVADLCVAMSRFPAELVPSGVDVLAKLGNNVHARSLIFLGGGARMLMDCLLGERSEHTCLLALLNLTENLADSDAFGLVCPSSLEPLIGLVQVRKGRDFAQHLLVLLERLQKVASFENVAVRLAVLANQVPELGVVVLGALLRFRPGLECIGPLGSALRRNAQTLPFVVECIDAMSDLEQASEKVHQSIVDLAVHVLWTAGRDPVFVRTALKWLLRLSRSGLGYLAEQMPRALCGAVQDKIRSDLDLVVLACAVVKRFSPAMHVSKLDDVVGQVVRPALLLSTPPPSEALETGLFLIVSYSKFISPKRLLDLSDLLLRRVSSDADCESIFSAIAPLRYDEFCFREFLTTSVSISKAMKRVGYHSPLGMEILAWSTCAKDLRPLVVEGDSFGLACEVVWAAAKPGGEVTAVASACVVLAALTGLVPQASRLHAASALMALLDSWVLPPSPEPPNPTHSRMGLTLCALYCTVKYERSMVISGRTLLSVARGTNLLARTLAMHPGNATRQLKDGMTAGLRVSCIFAKVVFGNQTTVSAEEAVILSSVSDDLHVVVGVCGKLNSQLLASDPAYVGDLNLLGATLMWITNLAHKNERRV